MFTVRFNTFFAKQKSNKESIKIEKDIWIGYDIYVYIYMFIFYGCMHCSWLQLTALSMIQLASLVDP